jgi:phytoene synthase
MSGEAFHVDYVRERDMDRYLATLYAPAALRSGLFALHALDLELAEVVRTTTEPMLGQIRLAWWREQLQGLDAGARPAQPVLVALAEHVLPQGVSGASLEPLEDANLALLEEQGLAAHALARGRLFGVAARYLIPGADVALVETAERLGAGWAAVEALLAGHFPADEAAAALAAGWLVPAKSPTGVRPLFALAALARHDLAALRRAGFDPSRVDRRRGTPARQVRLLWSIMTGT